ncbi:unnamed protein product [Merluccius merluccius]
MKCKKSLVFFLDEKAVKHLLNIGGYGNRFLPEPKKNTQEAIVEVGPLKQDLIKGDSFKAGTRIKHHTDFPWLLWVINPENGQEKLAQMQEQMGRPVRKLLKEVETRWNSTYIMLERLSSERGYITNNVPPNVILLGKWSIVRAIKLLTYLVDLENVSS